MVAVSIDESKRVISHAINNRLNTLALGMSYLENQTSSEQQAMVRSMKMELRDLQELIEQLKRHNI
ncbi:MAG: hypothetical protein AAFV93_21310 [Chloroflexota bacterium]